jgi:ABC-type multidrug transport system fused ATPase/permease subunit
VEQGRLVEDGTHAALIRANGRYAHLWRLQSQEPAHLAGAPT